MPPRVPESLDDVTVYLVLNDHGKHGIAYDETEPTKADLESAIQNFLTGQYENALRVVAFNTAEGWSRDVSEDIAHEPGDQRGRGPRRGHPTLRRQALQCAGAIRPSQPCGQPQARF
jgi:hypothetical protein